MGQMARMTCPRRRVIHYDLEVVLGWSQATRPTRVKLQHHYTFQRGHSQSVRSCAGWVYRNSSSPEPKQYAVPCASERPPSENKTAVGESAAVDALFPCFSLSPSPLLFSSSFFFFFFLYLVVSFFLAFFSSLQPHSVLAFFRVHKQKPLSGLVSGRYASKSANRAGIANSNDIYM